MAEAVVVVEELATHGMPLLVWVISPAICGNILAHHASEDMKQRWLPVIADGTKIMAFGLTEPDAGSNSHNVKTTARRTETGWTIGSKYYISAVDQSDTILVVARDAEHSTPEKSALSLFVVPTDSPGLSFQEIDTSIVSPDKQFTVYFDNVEVGHDALIGIAGNGLRQVFAGLNPERILVGALCGGIGRYAVGKAADYAKERQVWSTPIGAHQGIAHPLAEAHIAVELSRMATVRSAELFDRGPKTPQRPRISRSSPPPKPRSRRSTRRSRLTAATAFPRVRAVRAVVRHPADAHRAGQPGDGAELRRPVVAGSAPLLLGLTRNSHEHSAIRCHRHRCRCRVACSPLRAWRTAATGLWWWNASTRSAAARPPMTSMASRSTTAPSSSRSAASPSRHAKRSGAVRHPRARTPLLYRIGGNDVDVTGGGWGFLLGRLTRQGAKLVKGIGAAREDSGLPEDEISTAEWFRVTRKTKVCMASSATCARRFSPLDPRICRRGYSYLLHPQERVQTVRVSPEGTIGLWRGLAKAIESHGGQCGCPRRSSRLSPMARR